MNRQEDIRRMLFDYMYENQVSLKYVSEMLGLSYGSLLKFKNNKTELGTETLMWLERFLGIIQEWEE